MGVYLFYIIGILGFASIAYSLIRSSRIMRERATKRNKQIVKRYENLISTSMILGVIIALCSICLIIFTLLDIK